MLTSIIGMTSDKYYVHNVLCVSVYTGIECHKMYTNKLEIKEIWKKMKGTSVIRE